MTQDKRHKPALVETPPFTPLPEALLVDTSFLGSIGVNSVEREAFIEYVRTHDHEVFFTPYVVEEIADRLRKSAEVYRYLGAQTEVPVPAVRTVEPTGGDCPYPYTIVEYVDGEELSSIAQFKSFPQKRKTALVREMGRVLGTLHEQTHFETYGPISVRSDRTLTVDDGVSNWRNYYLSRYEERLDAATDSPVADLVTRACEFFKEASGGIAPDPSPVLLHADFTPDNLITKDGSVRAVLDWELARAGYSANELWTVEEDIVNVFQTEAVRSALRDALYEGYAESRPTSEAFLAMKSLFAVGEFTRVGSVYSVLSDLDDEFDASELRTRAEQDLDARIEDAESRLDRGR